MTKVVVGLSGGVDSSVAAASLQQQGHDIIGLTLWLMKGKGQCCSDGMVDAAFICEQLGIEHHIVDIRDTFETYIINYLVEGYEAGVTPLPCSQCNRTVKFGPMLDYAQDKLGADKIATGHYARIEYDRDLDRYQLLRAVDPNKDQSYFLYDLTQRHLGGSLFPLGEQTKDVTRTVASQLDLKTAHKPESQDLCLIESHGSMQSFLDKYLEPKPGQIVLSDGTILGEHQGIHHYTIGQRRGLGIAYREPLYVIKLDPAMNQVIVGPKTEGAVPFCRIHRVNWVSMAPTQETFTAEVQIRYRSRPTPVKVMPLPEEPDCLQLEFLEPQFGVTPGQAAVVYDSDRVLVGGLIERPNA